MKFKICRKCKKDFSSKNKSYIYFKIYKNKIKNINKIVFNFIIDDLKSVILNDNLEIIFIIIVINITIIFVNNNEIINGE